MKVLFVASGNKAIFTMSPVVANQAESLRTEGVQVDVFCIHGKGFRGYMRNIKPLRKYLREHTYDAVHAHFSLTAFLASLAGAKPLVVSLMGSDVKASGWYKFMIRLFAYIFRWKAIIVKSNDMYRSLGIKRAMIIPNGVDLERFRPMDKSECQKRLGWEPKKIHIVFPALKARPEKDYALAETAVKELANERVIEFEIHTFEDDVPNEETPYWYNAADVVLMTSKWEGSPNAIKEAMACSRPIVTTNVGDVAERMCGVEGCYVVPIDDKRLIIEDLRLKIEEAMKFAETKGREKIIADGLAAKEINQRLISVYR